MQEGQGMWCHDVRDGHAMKIVTILDGAGDVACVWCRHSYLLNLRNDQTHAENAKHPSEGAAVGDDSR